MFSVERVINKVERMITKGVQQCDISAESHLLFLCPYNVDYWTNIYNCDNNLNHSYSHSYSHSLCDGHSLQ